MTVDRPEMAASSLDRLSTLVRRFSVRAQPDDAAGNLQIAPGRESGGGGVAFWPRGRGPKREDACKDGRNDGGAVDTPFPPPVVGFALDLGSEASPVLGALPARILVALADCPEIAALTAVILAEARTPRCGGASALDRLCEVLVILLMRRAIAEGRAEPGLLAGLAHPQLSRAVVALHDAPGAPWTTDMLAARAGMSRSKFMDSFRETLGRTPMAYLGQWRMELARLDLRRGDAVAAVARRYGYGGAEAFSKAFARALGAPPSAFKGGGDERAPR